MNHTAELSQPSSMIAQPMLGLKMYFSLNVVLFALQCPETSAESGDMIGVSNSKVRPCLDKNRARKERHRYSIKNLFQ